MRVLLAKKVGFCFGVKRAVEMAEGVLATEGRASSLGSIIHNKQVVEDLSRRGLKVIKRIDEVSGGAIVISSHGISPEIAAQISRRSLKLIDTTCPFVRVAQRIASTLTAEGYKVVIVGDKDHPEVRALVDYAGKKAHVVKDVNALEVLKIGRSDKIGVISQTTQSMDNYLKVVRSIIALRPDNIRVFNTICKDAEERQSAAREVASEVDLMLIVGGRNSANTRRLYEVCKKLLKASYLIETEKDIQGKWFNGVRAVGITSGASTPDSIVRQVANAVRTKIKSHKKGRLQRVNDKRKQRYRCRKK